MGLKGFRTGGRQEKKDSGRRDSGLKGFRTGGIQEKKDTGKEGFGTEGILDWRDM